MKNKKHSPLPNFFADNLDDFVDFEDDSFSDELADLEQSEEFAQVPTIYLTLEQFLQLLQEQLISLDDISEYGDQLEGYGRFSDDLDLEELLQSQNELDCFDEDIPEYEMDMSDLDDTSSFNLLDILSNCEIISEAENSLSFMHSGKVEVYYCD